MATRTATRPAVARLNGTGVAGGHKGLPHLIDVATLAELFAMTERTIRRKVAHREIPYYKLGNSIRFDPVEIRAWLDACRVATLAAAQNGTRRLVSKHHPAPEGSLHEPDQQTRSPGQRASGASARSADNERQQPPRP